ncbi:uncharacterized protein LOC134447204 [Engraulis encrasicolus]|uniref:uncharacterized protein LOC134447204 n=1 Tax=Engraulis encrasicolus TaxID=184585 RepID=UPI002FD16C88
MPSRSSRRRASRQRRWSLWCFAGADVKETVDMGTQTECPTVEVATQADGPETAEATTQAGWVTAEASTQAACGTAEAGIQAVRVMAEAGCQSVWATSEASVQAAGVTAEADTQVDSTDATPLLDAELPGASVQRTTGAVPDSGWAVQNMYQTVAFEYSEFFRNGQMWVEVKLRCEERREGPYLRQYWYLINNCSQETAEGFLPYANGELLTYIEWYCGSITAVYSHIHTQMTTVMDIGGLLYGETSTSCRGLSMDAAGTWTRLERTDTLRMPLDQFFTPQPDPDDDSAGLLEIDWYPGDDSPGPNPDADGFDADGFDADGFDADGFDADGDNAGFDAADDDSADDDAADDDTGFDAADDDAGFDGDDAADDDAGFDAADDDAGFDAAEGFVKVAAVGSPAPGPHAADAAAAADNSTAPGFDDADAADDDAGFDAADDAVGLDTGFDAADGLEDAAAVGSPAPGPHAADAADADAAGTDAAAADNSTAPGFDDAAGWSGALSAAASVASQVPSVYYLFQSTGLGDFPLRLAGLRDAFAVLLEQPETANFIAVTGSMLLKNLATLNGKDAGATQQAFDEVVAFAQAPTPTITTELLEVGIHQLNLLDVVFELLLFRNLELAYVRLVLQAQGGFLDHLATVVQSLLPSEAWPPQAAQCWELLQSEAISFVLEILSLDVSAYHQPQHLAQRVFSSLERRIDQLLSVMPSG